MSENNDAPRSRGWISAILSVQGIAIFLAGCLLSGTSNWFNVVGGIRELQAKDLVHEDRMARIEREQQQQRVDSKDQVRAVQDQVTGVAGDVKEILRYLRDSSASKRSELGGWSK